MLKRILDACLRRYGGWLLVQAACVTGLFALGTGADFFAVLFVPLSLQAVMRFGGRAGSLWIAFFCACMFLGLRGVEREPLFGLGMTAVVNAEGRLTGIITDGDLKRLLLRHRDIMDLAVASCMTPAPRTIGPDESVSGALMRMEADPGRLITSLVVVDDAGELHGVIHLHDCLQACLS